jgi:hypothetical protein
MNPFANKIVEFISRCAPHLSEYVGGAELKILAGKQFLVGTDVQETSYRKGLEVWLAMDDVAQISIFASLEDMRERLSTANQLAENEAIEGDDDLAEAIDS